MEDNLIIIVSVFSCAWAALLIIALVLCGQVSSLRKKVAEMQTNGRMRIQKLKLDNENNHAFHNPALVPDEELSRRGYSMYMGQEDLESGRHERQTGGQLVEKPTAGQFANHSTGNHFMDKPNGFVDRQSNGHYMDRPASGHFVDELTRELDSRQQRPNNAPPFLLQSIQESRRKTRSLNNPVTNGRQSDTNPNFIY